MLQFQRGRWPVGGRREREREAKNDTEAEIETKAKNDRQGQRPKQIVETVAQREVKAERVRDVP